MKVSTGEIDLAADHPGVVFAVNLAHVAWCEQLSRYDSIKGQRYLAALPNEMRGSGLRVRVAAVLSVMKDIGTEPDDLVRVDTLPVVSTREIYKFMYDELLLRFMTLANDAWDDEVLRHYPDYERIRFLEKYKYRGKTLFAASQLAVLKCIPAISLKGERIARKSFKVGV